RFSRDWSSDVCSSDLNKRIIVFRFVVWSGGSCFRSFFDHFLRLCPIHIRANSISTFSSPFIENLLNRSLLFIWPKTASTSMGRLLRWYFPVSEVSRSRALAFSSFRRSLPSIILLPLALWHCPRMGRPSQRPA